MLDSLAQLTAEVIASGEPLLSIDEINKEVAKNRGGYDPDVH